MNASADSTCSDTQRRGPSQPSERRLALVLTAGFWLPPPLVAWFRAVAAALGG